MDPIDIDSAFRIFSRKVKGFLYIQRVGIPPLVIPVEENIPPPLPFIHPTTGTRIRRGAYQKKTTLLPPQISQGKPTSRQRTLANLSPVCLGIELFSVLAHGRRSDPLGGGVARVIEMYSELHRVNFSLSLHLRLTSRELTCVCESWVMYPEHIFRLTCWFLGTHQGYPPSLCVYKRTPLPHPCWLVGRPGHFAGFYSGPIVILPPTSQWLNQLSDGERMRGGPLIIPGRPPL